MLWLLSEAPYLHLERAIETVKEAQKLLGVMTIGEGSAQVGVGGGGS
jgi:hypothetical protein